MQKMTIETITLTPADESGQVTAYSHIVATAANATILIEIRFEPNSCSVWDEAYERTLTFLDIA